jgi:hypothetical protein
MGFIAIGIVAALFVSAGGLVAIIHYLNDPDGKSERDAENVVSTGDPRDDVSYIAGHRWWVKVPTTAKVDALVTYVIETNADREVLVDEECRYVRTTRTDWFAPQEMKGRRYFRVDYSGSKRPDRQTVLQLIRETLDEREFKDGPGSFVLQERAKSEEQAKAEELRRRKAGQEAEEQARAERVRAAQGERKREEKEIQERNAKKQGYESSAKAYLEAAQSYHRMEKKTDAIRVLKEKILADKNLSATKAADEARRLLKQWESE